MSGQPERFCTRCEVVLELHPSQQQTDDEWECELAQIKADRLAKFWSPAVRS